MNRLFHTILIFFLATSTSFSQEGLNTSGGMQSANSGKADQMANTSVNYFTGVPNIAFPLYSYKNENNGLKLDISLSYFAGGTRVMESPTTVGLGWSLNAGGTITRTVRGMPDDIATYGFLYAGNISTDFRNNASKYYYDSLDSQPDIFTFSCPGAAGRFFLGKDGTIVVVPKSKVKIIPYFQSGTSRTISGFRIVNEAGVKYDFWDMEHGSSGPQASSIWVKGGYFGLDYTTAWNLTRIISPFNTDTIKFNYLSGGSGGTFTFPQFAYYLNGALSVYPTMPTGTFNNSSNELQSIEFPDQSRVEFTYSRDKKSTVSQAAISKISIKDSVFRYGYLLDYDTSYITRNPVKPLSATVNMTKLLLRSLTPFTATQMQKGYQFLYRQPFLPLAGSYGDTMQNKRDHWGFFNGEYNKDSSLPHIPGYFGGAKRNANVSADANSLWRIYYPTGGFIQYTFENNERYPYTEQRNSFQLTPSTTITQNTVSFSQVSNSKHRIELGFENSFSRAGAAPISGTGTMTCTIKNTAGTITYASKTISLYTLYYQGLQHWDFNLPNGTYELQTQLASGSSISGSYPILISWSNRSDTTGNVLTGGLRVATIATYADEIRLPIRFQRFEYILENGKSSGFLGEVPKYDYPYRKVTPSTTYNYMVLQSDPISYNESIQGSPVGYGRVVVKEGIYNKLAYVYEFTDLHDVNAEVNSQSFPYAPKDIRAWGLGLPKKISTFDSTGRIVHKTAYVYSLDTVEYLTDALKGIKIGLSGSVYGTSNNLLSITTVGEEYFPKSGRMSLSKMIDTVFHLDGSVSTSWQEFQYDSNYNVKKVISPYDRTRGLNVETRSFYPYDYSIGGAIGKLRDSGINNITVSSENWITGDSNDRIMSANIISFKELSNGMIKPDTLFSLEANKPIPGAQIGSFSSSLLNRNYSYIRPKSIYLTYSSRGIPLETKAMPSGIVNTTIMDYDGKYPIAKVSNAILNDVAYTSFEADGNGNWVIASSLRNFNNSMTGKKSYDLANGTISKTGLTSSKTYVISFWAKQGASVSVNSANVVQPISTHNGWNLFTTNVSSSSTVTISGSGLIDEVRCHPIDANMTTTVLEPMIGVTCTSDPNNDIVYSEYDPLFRLTLVRNIDKNIIKRIQYSDSSFHISLLPRWVGIGAECNPTFGYDTLYLDMNPFSDSAGYVRKEFVRLDCSCPSIANNPQYKNVNGNCEVGTFAVTSSVYKKVEIDGYLQWRWVCTAHYCFSDGSQSEWYSESYSTTPCSTFCIVEI